MLSTSCHCSLFKNMLTKGKVKFCTVKRPWMIIVSGICCMYIINVPTSTLWKICLHIVLLAEGIHESCLFNFKLQYKNPLSPYTPINSRVSEFILIKFTFTYFCSFIPLEQHFATYDLLQEFGGCFTVLTKCCVHLKAVLARIISKNFFQSQIQSLAAASQCQHKCITWAAF